jgi:hypothetical protein
VSYRRNELSLAYANRSAVYMEIKRYTKCLLNITCAIKTGYPEDKMPKLLERKAKCEQAMKGVVEQKYGVKINLKLTRPANPKLPCLADCLELRNDQKYGNHIITTQQLQPGDVIATEDFFYYSLTKHDISTRLNTDNNIDDKVYYQFCAYCFSSHLLNLFPCTGCTITMYCSEKCRNSAYESYHKYECSSFADMFKMFGLGTRMFCQALSICKGDIKELQQLINLHILSGNPQLTAFDLDYTTMSEDEIKKKSILIAYSGTPNAQGSPFKYTDIQKYMEMSSTTTELMRTHGKFIIRFIKRMDRIQTNYGHNFIKPLQKANAPRIDTGSGRCLALSLFSHSCTPNVFRVANGEKGFALVANTVIEAGEQLFDSYL